MRLLNQVETRRSAMASGYEQLTYYRGREKAKRIWASWFLIPLFVCAIVYFAFGGFYDLTAMIFICLVLYVLFIWFIPDYFSKKNYKNAEKKLNMEIEAANYKPYWAKCPFMYYSGLYTDRSFFFYNKWNGFEIIVRDDYKDIIEVSFFPIEWIERIYGWHYLKIVLESKDGTVVSYRNLRCIVPNKSKFIDDFNKWFYTEGAPETSTEGIKNGEERLDLMLGIVTPVESAFLRLISNIYKNQKK